MAIHHFHSAAADENLMKIETVSELGVPSWWTEPRIEVFKFVLNVCMYRPR